MRALAGGATDFVIKPFDEAEVLLRISNLLQTRCLHLDQARSLERLEETVRDRTGELRKALDELKDKLNEIDARLFALFADWDGLIDRDADEAARKSVLDRMSQLLSHRSYVRNLVRDIREEL